MELCAWLPACLAACPARPVEKDPSPPFLLHLSFSSRSLPIHFSATPKGHPTLTLPLCFHSLPPTPFAYVVNGGISQLIRHVYEWHWAYGELGRLARSGVHLCCMPSAWLIQSAPAAVAIKKQNKVYGGRQAWRDIWLGHFKAFFFLKRNHFSTQYFLSNCKNQSCSLCGPHFVSV